MGFRGSLGALGTLGMLRYHAAMSHIDEDHARRRELADLQQAFPQYRIWQEPMGDRIRLVAVRRAPGTGPHTLVSAEPTELRAALASSAP